MSLNYFARYSNFTPCYFEKLTSSSTNLFLKLPSKFLTKTLRMAQGDFFLKGCFVGRNKKTGFNNEGLKNHSVSVICICVFATLLCTQTQSYSQGEQVVASCLHVPLL